MWIMRRLLLTDDIIHVDNEETIINGWCMKNPRYDAYFGRKMGVAAMQSVKAQRI